MKVSVNNELCKIEIRGQSLEDSVELSKLRLKNGFYEVRLFQNSGGDLELSFHDRIEKREEED